MLFVPSISLCVRQEVSHWIGEEGRAAVFKISKRWKQPWVHVWMGKQNEVHPCTGMFSLRMSDTCQTLVNLDIMLHEISQLYSGKYCIIALMKDTYGSQIHRHKEWWLLEGGHNRDCLMGTEFQFCKMKSSRDAWWWWLHNNVSFMPLNDALCHLTHFSTTMENLGWRLGKGRKEAYENNL